jgi:hypothetical protein
MIDLNYENLMEKQRSERSADYFVSEFSRQNSDVMKHVCVPVWNQRIRIKLKHGLINVTKMLVVNMADFSTLTFYFSFLLY